jgi:transmembrane protein
MNIDDSVRGTPSLASRAQALLGHPFFFYLGAVMVTYKFWWSGITKLWDFSGAQAETAHFGLNPPWFFALGTIALQLVGSALVTFGGRYAWLGAAALALFTLATIPLAHAFWKLEGQAAIVEKLWAQEHTSMVGGLILAAVLAGLRSRPAKG